MQDSGINKSVKQRKYISLAGAPLSSFSHQSSDSIATVIRWFRTTYSIMISLLEMLFEHNFALRPMLIDSLKAMTREEFEKNLGVEKDSLRNILIHLVMTDNYWISVLTDTEMLRIDKSKFDGPETIAKVWSVSEGRIKEIIRNMTEQWLQYVKSVRWGEQTVSFTIAKALVHMATHETHHRGLLVGLIRQLGYEPPNVNMI